MGGNRRRRVSPCYTGDKGDGPKSEDVSPAARALSPVIRTRYRPFQSGTSHRRPGDRRTGVRRLSRPKQTWRIPRGLVHPDNPPETDHDRASPHVPPKAPYLRWGVTSGGQRSESPSSTDKNGIFSFRPRRKTKSLQNLWQSLVLDKNTLYKRFYGDVRKGSRSTGYLRRRFLPPRQSSKSYSCDVTHFRNRST